MSNPFLDHDSDKYGYQQSKLEDIRNKNIESQKNALKSLAISEQIGINTAAELMDQGEKLDRTNQRLDDIAEMQKVSDKHIRNLNSGFIGGFIGLFKKKEVQAPAESTKNKVYDTYRDQNLSNMVQNYKPAPGSDTGGPGAAGLGGSGGGSYRDQFDRNLDDMSQGVGRLNNLAKGLGTELDRQNELLAVMTPKTDKINSTISNHNKQLNVLLHGKSK